MGSAGSVTNEKELGLLVTVVADIFSSPVPCELLSFGSFTLCRTFDFEFPIARLID